MSTPTIYVSAQRPLGDWFDDLLSRLRAAGLDVLWRDRFRGYETIAHEINARDALLAVITWESAASTWQATEISLASGFPGAGWVTVRPAPRPVFIYATTTLPGYMTGLDMSEHPPLHVTPDPVIAVDEIMREMKER